MLFTDWGGYLDAVKGCDEEDPFQESTKSEKITKEKLLELDPVFIHLFKLEETRSLYQIKNVLEEIPFKDLNKLNSKILDILNESITRFYDTSKLFLLEFMVEKGNLYAVKFLLDREPYFLFESAFYKAVEHGHLPLVKFFAEKIKFEIHSKAFTYALKNNHTEVAKFLVYISAPIGPQVFDFFRYDNLELVKLLYDYGKSKGEIYIDKLYKKALVSGFRETVKFCIERNVKIHREDLLLMITNQDKELVEIMLKDEEISDYVKRFKDAIRTAVRGFNREILTLLFDAGVDKTAIDLYPLIQIKNNKNLIFLLEKGTPLSQYYMREIEESGNTTLMEYIEEKQIYKPPAKINYENWRPIPGYR